MHTIISMPTIQKLSRPEEIFIHNFFLKANLSTFTIENYFLIKVGKQGRLGFGIDRAS
jgi:hypothetical protein